MSSPSCTHCTSLSSHCGHLPLAHGVQPIDEEDDTPLVTPQKNLATQFQHLTLGSAPVASPTPSFPNPTPLATFSPFPPLLRASDQPPPLMPKPVGEGLLRDSSIADEECLTELARHPVGSYLAASAPCAPNTHFTCRLFINTSEGECKKFSLFAQFNQNGDITISLCEGTREVKRVTDQWRRIRIQRSGPTPSTEEHVKNYFTQTFFPMTQSKMHRSMPAFKELFNAALEDGASVQPSSPVNQSPWQCRTCTQLNTSDLEACHSCYTPNPSLVSAARQVTSAAASARVPPIATVLYHSEPPSEPIGPQPPSGGFNAFDRLQQRAVSPQGSAKFENEMPEIECMRYLAGKSPGNYLITHRQNPIPGENFAFQFYLVNQKGECKKFLLGASVNRMENIEISLYTENLKLGSEEGPRYMYGRSRPDRTESKAIEEFLTQDFFGSYHDICFLPLFKTALQNA